MFLPLGRPFGLGLKGAPHWLPDDVDGRELVRVATVRAQALAAGLPDPGGVAALGENPLVKSYYLGT